ncbi:MAG: glutathione S-transferase family protein [Rhizobiaceae bacterium]
MKTWQLHTSLTSPFGRKVRVAAGICGLSERIELVPVNVMDPDPSFRRQNPLAKVPVLVDDTGYALYDSRVILEWLDGQAGGGVVLPAGAARFPALRMQALADGIGDALLLLVYERRLRTPDMRSAVWMERQARRSDLALATLEEALPAFDSRTPHVGDIALACMLGLGDSHFGGKWRADHPRLVEWVEAFAERVPAFRETVVAPVPD